MTPAVIEWWTDLGRGARMPFLALGWALIGVAAWLGSAFVTDSVLPRIAAATLTGEGPAPAPGGPKFSVLGGIITAVIAATVLVAIATYFRRRLVLAMIAALVTAAVVFGLAYAADWLGPSKDGWPNADQSEVAITMSRQLLGGLLITVLLLVAWRADLMTFLVTLAVVGAVGLIGLASAARLVGYGVKEAATPDRAELSMTVTVVGVIPNAGESVSLVFLVPKVSDRGEVTGHDEVRQAAVVKSLGTDCAAASCVVVVEIDRGTDDGTVAAVLRDWEDATSPIYLIGTTGVIPTPTTAPAPEG